MLIANILEANRKTASLLIIYKCSILDIAQNYALRLEVMPKPRVKTIS